MSILDKLVVEDIVEFRLTGDSYALEIIQGGGWESIIQLDKEAVWLLLDEIGGLYNKMNERLEL